MDLVTLFIRSLFAGPMRAISQPRSIGFVGKSERPQSANELWMGCAAFDAPIRRQIANVEYAAIGRQSTVHGPNFGALAKSAVWKGRSLKR